MSSAQNIESELFSIISYLACWLCYIGDCLQRIVIQSLDISRQLACHSTIVDINVHEYVVLYMVRPSLRKSIERVCRSSKFFFFFSLSSPFLVIIHIHLPCIIESFTS